MDTTEKLASILDLCIDIDKAAADIYSDLSASTNNEALKSFWKKMVDEGYSHLAYWERLKTFAGENELPEAFEDPDGVLHELEGRAKQIQALLEQWEKDRSVGNSFVIAYRLESYKLHPAFRTLFQYFRPLTDEIIPEEKDIDETNINAFVEAVQKYGDVSPEMELVGETLQRLWNQNKILTQQAMLDELTTLLNRRGFLLMAKQLAHLSKRNRTSVSILIAEVDNFKQINTLQGVRKGDEVLKEIAVKLQSTLRGSDLIARYGGDEFIALLPNTPGEGGMAVAEKIRRSIERTRPGGVPVTVSIGVSESTMKDNVQEELQSLIRYAEGNVIVAKTSGKNKVVY